MNFSGKYSRIFIAPHLDDAVYSCGGVLSKFSQEGQRTLVVTVFAGVPDPGLELSVYAKNLYKRKQYVSNPQELVLIRRKQDISALDYLGVDYLHLDYLDAIYRGDPPFYSERGQVVGGNVHPADSQEAIRIFQDLNLLYSTCPDAIWYAPLGVGLHVDHQIMFQIATELVQQGAPVLFYEDFPYVLKEQALQNRLHLVDHPTCVDISLFLQQRCAASSKYRTELSSFGREDVLYARIQEHAGSITHGKCLERYWTITRCKMKYGYVV